MDFPEIIDKKVCHVETLREEKRLRTEELQTMNMVNNHKPSAVSVPQREQNKLEEGFMKLIEFKQIKDYTFFLKFQNGEVKETDLKDLIGKHVSPENLHTAKMNTEWGCLEFLSGAVDIEPKTLYKYAAKKTAYTEAYHD
jgi:hypothetical protein